MKPIKSDLFKLSIKIIVSLLLCLVYSIPAAYCCFYLPRVWGEDRLLRQFGLIFQLACLLILGFGLHFLICHKIAPFKNNKYKIIYWAVSIVFMNPYVWYGIIYLISCIPGVNW